MNIRRMNKGNILLTTCTLESLNRLLIIDMYMYMQLTVATSGAVVHPDVLGLRNPVPADVVEVDGEGGHATSL